MANCPQDQVFYGTEPGLSAGLLSTNTQLVAHSVGRKKRLWKTHFCYRSSSQRRRFSGILTRAGNEVQRSASARLSWTPDELLYSLEHPTYFGFTIGSISGTNGEVRASLSLPSSSHSLILGNAFCESGLPYLFKERARCSNVGLREVFLAQFALPSPSSEHPRTGLYVCSSK